VSSILVTTWPAPTAVLDEVLRQPNITAVVISRYWWLRVAEASKGRVRQQVLRQLVASMVASRSQQVDDAVLSDSGMVAVLDDLLRDGVLRDGPASRWSPSRPVRFSHPVLFDYAASVLALGDLSTADSLADTLDVDSDLAMVLDSAATKAWPASCTTTARFSSGNSALELSADRSGTSPTTPAQLHTRSCPRTPAQCSS
jgi:hypothetical protein